MPSPSIVKITKAFELTGSGPVVAGSVQVYLRGTATPAILYTDATGGSTTANPTSIVNGLVNVWITAGSYDLVPTIAGVTYPTTPLEAVSGADAAASVAIDGAANVGTRRTLGTGALQAMAGNDSRVTGLIVNVKSYGAVGDGITDDTAAINQAISIVAAQGGGDVLIPNTRTGFKTFTGVQMVPGVRLIGGLAPLPLEYGSQNLGASLIGAAGQPVVRLPTTGLGGFTQKAACSISNLALLGGQDGIVAVNGGAGFHMSGLYIAVTRYGINPNGFTQSWTGDRVEIAGGQIGFNYSPTPGVGGDPARLDDADFNEFYFHGQALNAINVDLVSGTSVRWSKLRTVTPAQDAVVIGGGASMWTIDDWNCEAVGYTGPGTYVAPTTGSIAFNSFALAVASGVGYNNGATVTIQNGAANGDLITTIVSGGGGVVLTLAAACTNPNGVNGADVRIGTASELKLVNTARGTPQLIVVRSHISGAGGRTDSNLRYSIDDTPGTQLEISGSVNNAFGPHYDPGGVMSLLDPAWIVVRRPPLVVGPLDASPWQPITPSVGWANSGGTNPPLAWRRIGRRVFLRGALTAAAGATATIANLPNIAQPTNTLTYFGQTNVAAGLTQIGATITTNATAAGTIVAVNLDYWTDE